MSMRWSLISWYLSSTDFSRLSNIDSIVALKRFSLSSTWVMSTCDGVGNWRSGFCSSSSASLDSSSSPSSDWGKFFLFDADYLKWKHFLVVGSLSFVLDENISALVSKSQLILSCEIEGMLIVRGLKTWKCKAKPVTIWPIEIDALGAQATCHNVCRMK